jgi:Na+-transporting NADH:ubiquinone oxidoreductase subunit NqrC
MLNARVENVDGLSGCTLMLKSVDGQWKDGLCEDGL